MLTLLASVEALFRHVVHVALGVIALVFLAAALVVWVIGRMRKRW